MLKLIQTLTTGAKFHLVPTPTAGRTCRSHSKSVIQSEAKEPIPFANVLGFNKALLP
ncbi:hypothetical protein [Siphonobacter sp. SORGH_AS_1065]|uniref:hypothetical protein n=1 Tax=Siphonobacter sp. SORGH_AS_1065 TaxID=3041795 RepID=UPI0027829DD9|nr:hypothetical protein [Siphonobacter sp. SORGH_AS_1065]MDQ1088071.1 hypothetical protein [Siphonobacter sp. SORGH_AS_1065]